jgi:hypothetical protein
MVCAVAAAVAAVAIIVALVFRRRRVALVGLEAGGDEKD